MQDKGVQPLFLFLFIC